MYILIVYYSHSGRTAQMAEHIAWGVERVQYVESRVRQVPPVAPITQIAAPPVPEKGPPYVTLNDVRDCAGLAVGSPTHFGNMAAPLKYFLDTTSELWHTGALIDKPVALFTSTASLHGGQEATLLSMMLPFFHHGSIVIGLPYSHSELSETTSGGTPYGPSHHARHNTSGPDTTERTLCMALGERLAKLSARLLNPHPREL